MGGLIPDTSQILDPHEVASLLLVLAAVPWQTPKRVDEGVSGWVRFIVLDLVVQGLGFDCTGGWAG